MGQQQQQQAAATIRYQRALASRISLLGRSVQEVQAFAAQAALQAGQVATLCEQATIAGMAAALNGDNFDPEQVEEVNAAMEAALRVASQRMSLRAAFLAFSSVQELRAWELAAMAEPGASPATVAEA